MNNRFSEKEKRILVIDDSSEIQQLIKMSLEMMKGWTVITANSGLEGIDIAYKEENLDVIILDYLMPDMNGEKILKKLQTYQQTATIPVIFLTAQSQNKLHWQNMGAKGVIAKPFNPLHLGDLIENFL